MTGAKGTMLGLELRKITLHLYSGFAVIDSQ